MCSRPHAGGDGHSAAPHRGCSRTHSTTPVLINNSGTPNTQHPNQLQVFTFFQGGALVRSGFASARGVGMLWRAASGSQSVTAVRVVNGTVTGLTIVGTSPLSVLLCPKTPLQ